MTDGEEFDALVLLLDRMCGTQVQVTIGALYAGRLLPAAMFGGELRRVPGGQVSVTWPRASANAVGFASVVGDEVGRASVFVIDPETFTALPAAGIPASAGVGFMHGHSAVLIAPLGAERGNPT